MAPRARSKKVGLMRMDAAVDALTPMGFSAAFIRSKVKELLKLYGDEGWPFIEEASYRLLIDYILDPVGTESQGEPSHKDEDKEGGTEEIETTGAGPSQELTEAICDSEETTVLSPVTVLTPLPTAETTLSPSGKHTGHSGSEDLGWVQVHNRRKPCLGWIGSKEEEHFVLLRAAPLSCRKAGENRRKRKSRWDVR